MDGKNRKPSVVSPSRLTKSLLDVREEFPSEKKKQRFGSGAQGKCVEGAFDTRGWVLKSRLQSQPPAERDSRERRRNYNKTFQDTRRKRQGVSLIELKPPVN